MLNCIEDRVSRYRQGMAQGEGEIICVFGSMGCSGSTSGAGHSTTCGVAAVSGISAGVVGIFNVYTFKDKLEKV